MLIRIRHETIYDYDRPVFLEPMTIRLVPREDVAQRLIEHDITIAPPPDGMSKTIEQDGATAHNIWFGGTHERLTIVTNALVETRRTNPFDYLITHEPAQRVPASYPAHLVKVLAPFREPCGSGPVIEWSRELGQDAGDLTTAFLRAVTDRIHDTFRIVERPEGAPFAPEKTLAEQMGSCRDVAMLFIAACRAQGIAARFVSGYSTHHPPETTQHELHAWAEVYLPSDGS